MFLSLFALLGCAADVGVLGFDPSETVVDADGVPIALAARVLPPELSEAAFARAHAGPRQSVAARVMLADGPGFLEVPKNEPGPFPALLVLHREEVDAHQLRWAERLAADGYVALAIGLEPLSKLQPEAKGHRRCARDARRIFARLAEARRFLERDPRVQPESIGVIGFGCGGYWAIAAALYDPRLELAVSYYDVPDLELTQRVQLDAEVLGIFSSSMESRQSPLSRFESVLAQNGIEATLLRYAAGDGFADPASAAYDPGAAEAAWREVRVFLARHLAGPPRFDFELLGARRP